MTHPTPEERIAYLYGETDSSIREAVTRHLRSCADCRAAFDADRRTMLLLNEWELPPVRLSRRTPPRWAGPLAAALIVAAAGFGAGRWTSPPVIDAVALKEEMRAELKSTLKEELKAELRKTLEPELRASLRREWSGDLAQTRLALRNELDSELTDRANALRTELASASAAEQQRFAEGFFAAYRTAEQSDKAWTLAVLQEMERKRAAERDEIKRALTSLASLTGERLDQTRQRLNELALLPDARRTVPASHPERNAP